MDKNFRKCLSVLILISFLMAGCASKKTLDDSTDREYSNSSETTAEDLTTSATDDSCTNTAENTERPGDSFRMYQIVGTDQVNEFDQAVADNPIDQDYQSEKGKASANQELVDIERKYINLWKQKMNKNTDLLKTVLAKADYDQYKTAQDGWETQMLNDYKTDNALITDNTVQLGSCYNWLYLSNIREEYRQRAFHDLYMYQLIKTKAGA